MPEHKINILSYLLVSSILFLCSGCSFVEPLPMKDLTVSMVWPQSPNIPRISYLREIKGPEDIYPPKTRFQSLSEVITGDTRGIVDLITPYSVTKSKTDILYIADTSSGLVHCYDLRNREVDYIGKAGDDFLASPVAVALDRDDTLYISDSVNAKVYRFDSNGRFSGVLAPPGGFLRPAGIAIEKSGTKYVVDAVAHKLHKFADDDSYLGEFPKPHPDEELNTPSHVAIGGNGNIFITDALNFTVKVYDKEGNFINRIGEVGDVPGSFARPKGIALDSDNNIYVMDASHDNFQIFNLKGQLLLFVGENGAGIGEFYLPSGIHIDNQDRIFIADTFNRRIQVFQFLKAGGINE